MPNPPLYAPKVPSTLLRNLRRVHAFKVSLSFLPLDPHPPLLPPPRPPPHLRPQQRTRKKDNRRNERETPPPPHPIDHLNNHRSARRPNPTSHQIVRRRSGGGAQRIQIDEHGTHGIERARQAETDDEREDQGCGERRVLFEYPAPTQNGCYADIERDDEDLDPSFFKREISHIITALEVDPETCLFGYALIIHIHEVTENDGSYGSPYSKGDETQAGRLLPFCAK